MRNRAENFHGYAVIGVVLAGNERARAIRRTIVALILSAGLRVAT